MFHTIFTSARNLAACLLTLSLASFCAKDSSAANLYSTEVLANPSLISYWRLGETTGATTAVDQKGANPGTYVNPGATIYGQPGAIVGDPDTAVHFNGSTSYVNAGAGVSNAGLNGNFTGETLMAWVKPDSVAPAADLSQIMGQWNNDTAGDRIALFQNGADLLLAINDGSGTPGHDLALTVSNVLHAGQYNYVVGTWSNNGLLSLYVNGTPVGTLSTVDTSLNTLANAQFHIGAENDPVHGVGRYFPGTIDEAAVFNTALTALQIATLNNVGANVPEPGSVVLMGLGAAVLASAVVRRARQSGQQTK